MPRQPRYAKRYIEMAREAILAGKTAHKALALAMSAAAGVAITPTTLQAWIAQQPAFAAAVIEARAELARRKAETAPAQAGRKSRYASSMDDAARLHAAAGKDDKAIAKALGVSVTTLRNWRTEFPSFADAIQQGRDTWNVTAVEESLIKRALGYEYEETTTEDGDKGSRKVTTCRHMAPDTRAAQFVLTNRAPERWKSRQEVEYTGEVGLTMPDAIKDLYLSIMGQNAVITEGGEA